MTYADALPIEDNDFVNLRRKPGQGGWMSLKSKGAKFHAPIHKGCDCFVVAETLKAAPPGRPKVIPGVEPLGPVPVGVTPEWMKKTGVELDKALTMKTAANGLRQIKRIPDEVLFAMKKEGGKLRILKPGQNVTTQKEFVHLKGKTPKAWKNTGRTWEDVYAISNDIAMASITSPSSSSISSIRHEAGHQIDVALGRKFKIRQGQLSGSPEFNRVYKDLLSKGDEAGLRKYYKQPGIVGKEETFASFIDGYFADYPEVQSALKAGRLENNNRWGTLGRRMRDTHIQPMIEWWEGILEELK